MRVSERMELRRELRTGKPTLYQVGEIAGVSASTVSRVLNGNPSVSQQATKKVLKALADLGYENPRVESGGRRNRRTSVGLVIPDLSNPFFPLLVKGVETVGKIHKYGVVLWDSENSPEIEREGVETLIDQGVSGLLVIPAMGEDPLFRKLTEESFPIVFADRRIEIPKSCVVSSDNETGAYQAAKYLLSLGHRRILYVGGPDGLNTEKDRFAGYLKAIEEAGISPKRKLIVHLDYSLEEGFKLMHRFLETDPEFTAVFATNDLMAFGAIRACQDHRLRVPDDISVMGFDDIQFSSVLSLTTVSQRPLEMGRVSMTLLIDLMNRRQSPPQRVRIMPSLVIRNSCSRVVS